MAAILEKLLEGKKEPKEIKFDFTTFEKEYILKNANFTEQQEKIFKMLTGKYGRETITYIAMTLHISESTVKRRIAAIRFKIFRLL